MTSGTQENFQKKVNTEVAHFNIKIWNNSLFVIFLWFFSKFDYNKSRDMIQKVWKCIFDFISTLKE